MVINDVTGHNFGCVFLPGVSEELRTTFSPSMQRGVLPLVLLPRWQIFAKVGEDGFVSLYCIIYSWKIKERKLRSVGGSGGPTSCSQVSYIDYCFVRIQWIQPASTDMHPWHKQTVRSNYASQNPSQVSLYLEIILI